MALTHRRILRTSSIASRFPWSFLMCDIMALVVVPAAWARDYVVDMNDRKASDEGPGTPELPLKSLARGAQLAGAGDTVVVKPGLYRERVLVSNSGTSTAPIAFVADPSGSVVISGADLITGWQRVPGEPPIYRVPWPHRFVMAVKQGQEIEQYPYSLGEPGSPDEPRWGRAEQVLADRRHLIPVRSLDELAVAWEDIRGTSPYSIDELGVIPDPKDPAAWAGTFFADTTGKTLYVCLRGGADPNGRQMEAGTRLITFGTDRWHYVHDVHVWGFISRYGATLAGWGICCLDGSDNRVEDCLIEEASQNGILVKGSMRRCVVRNCGHVGGGAQGKNFLNEACLWEGNNWKPVRGWDSGGFKLGFSDQGVFRRCLFRRNHAQGLWLDCHVRNVLITECVFEGNWETGLFIEISRDIYVCRNLFIGNANVPGTGHDWGDAGIKLGESMNCVVAYNTCIGNKDGIALREGSGRPMKTEDYGDILYRCRGNVITANLCAYSDGYQLGLWYDNGFFWMHPGDKKKFLNEEAYAGQLDPKTVFDPSKMEQTIDRNLYDARPGQKIALYGVPWRVKHREFQDVSSFSAGTGFDLRSRQGDPSLIGLAAGDFRPDRSGLAWEMGVGWLTAPRDVNAWMAEVLPAWLQKDIPGKAHGARRKE